MGWWTSTKNYVKRASGKIARETVAVAAGVAGATACSIPPLTPFAPACGVGIAFITDELVGDRVEKEAKRAIDKSGAAADDFVDYLKGGQPAPRPPQMATTVTGTAPRSTSVRGEAIKPEDFPTAAVAAVAAAAVISVLTFWVLKRTGRI